MAPKLTVQNAEIKTAAVELKTLTVSGKQVTLAVFRQLREEPLIAEDGTLNGVPWGTVNYHPDKCGDAAPHWHVVWQRGPELLRSAVNVEPTFNHFISPTGNRFLMAAVWEHVTGGTRHFNNNPLLMKRDPHTGWESRQASRWITLAGIPVGMGVSPAAVAATAAMDTVSVRRDQAARNASWQTSLESAVEDLALKVAELRTDMGEARGSADELYAAFKVECAAEADRLKRHTTQREGLADLPQLFIAV